MNRKTQINIILDLLHSKDWVCTSDMYREFMSDPRRRLIDIKEMGYTLESRRCTQHGFHRGGSREWRIVAPPPPSKYEAYHEMRQNELL